MSTHNQRHVRELSRVAVEYGFRLDGMTKGGHLRWLGPKGSIMITSATPSDRRWLVKCRSMMRTLIKQGEQHE